MLHNSVGAGPTAAITSVEVFDTTKSTWSNAAPLPISMHHPNIATVDGKIYVLGGITFTDQRWNSLGNCYRYDPAARKWDALASMPDGTGRGSAAVGVFGKTIYLAGGIQIPDSANGTDGNGRIAVTMTQSYDTVSGKWTSLPNLIVASGEGRDHGGGAVINGTFFVVGGRNASRESVRGTLFAMDLNSPKPLWVAKATMPTARGGIAVASVGNKIHAFGGEGNPASGTRGVFSSSEVYDATKDAWEVETPMILPRHGTQAAAVGDNIYLAGGGLQQGFLDTDLFDVFKPGAACS